MSACVPNKETLEKAVLDFAWRCGRKAYDWANSKGLIPVVRLEKVLAAFAQGWRGQKLDVKDVFFSCNKRDLLDLAESGGSLATKRART